MLLSLCCPAQQVQTVVPRQAVVVGNAFQIQYIITQPSDLIEASRPTFDNLRLVSGPNYYRGNGLVDGKMQAIENITYTLVPLRTGSIKIGGIEASFRNRGKIKSADAVITVAAAPKASFNVSSSYTDVSLYAPSSKTDRDKLIAENLFIKAEADRNSCFVGEPIVASFKLYSRLQSTSEVLNAPSLYGFSVMDMVKINEAHQAVETINGKVFNTSLLRKLQLYPEQAGTLTIDEMQLQNEIEFDDSATGARIKVEKALASKPITVQVKALPANRPGNYSGAVGVFNMTAALAQPEVAAGQEGKLTVTISGKGNFIQFGQPVVDWPRNFDVFDPVITDELNRNAVPIEGKRVYHFNFTADSAGVFMLAPISFSFFDVASASFKTIRTDSFQIKIGAAVKIARKKNPAAVPGPSKAWWWILIPVVAAAVIVLLFYFRKKPPQVVHVAPPGRLQRFQEIRAGGLSEKQLCIEIQKLLSEIKNESRLSPGQKEELESIQTDCQLLIYSDAAAGQKSEAIAKRALQLITELD
jgi:hypothetical protein